MTITLAIALAGIGLCAYLVCILPLLGIAVGLWQIYAERDRELAAANPAWYED